MDKIEGLKLLKEIIDKDKKHQDYKRVTTLAETYYKMKTGDDIESMLQKIETRVTDEEFDQIKRIYRSIIPATLNSTKMPFLKATRKQPIRVIDYDEEADKKKVELEGFIGKYWGDKSLEKFMEYAYVDYNYIDPNAFLITEFDPFDPKIEKASPYPFIADSKEVIMFEYKNEILQYIVVMLPTTYMENDVEKPGVKYTMYLGMYTIVLSQVSKSDIELNHKYFEYEEYKPNDDKVPAMRFGYLRDERTKGRTFVSVFHSVIGFLEKTLKIDSELDLSAAMVAFPQRFSYTSPCPNPGCIYGKLPDNSICPVCQGTGIQSAHKGTQDIVTLSLPKNATPADMIDLNNLLVYKFPPIELLQFQKEYLEYLKKSVHAMMFNADLYTREEVSVTATEKIIETDNLNDTLYGFGQHYSALWEYVVKDIATFTDLIKGLAVHHQFPKDFKFKTLSELMTELQLAKNASASTSTISAIEDDINEILYSDRPEELKAMRIKNDVNPFRGYSEANIRFIISQGDTTRYNIVLWENLEAIFTELEQENEKPWLYDLDMTKILEKVKLKTQEYITSIDAERKAEQQFYTQPPQQ
jgi:hypothetical protein